MPTTYTVVNGPQFAQKITTLYGRHVRCYVFGEVIDYDNFDGAPVDFGQLLMVSGTKHVKSDEGAVILFTHLDYETTALNLKDGSLHPCEVVPPSDNQH